MNVFSARFVFALLLCLGLVSCGGGGGSTDNGGVNAPTPTNSAEPVNEPPTANAGADTSATGDSRIFLRASNSTDADGEIVDFSWSQVSGPTVTLENAATPTAVFTTPLLETDTNLTFRVTVTDNDGASASAEVTVTVIANSAPVADAGDDQFVDPTSLVSLNGTGSDDADGSISSYSWVQTSGPTVELANSDQVTASFTSPDVDTDTELGFELTVTDNAGASATDSVSIMVVTGSFSLSGTISIPQGTLVDSDVNDINVTPVSNNNLQEAQPISNPVTLGGYVTEAGAGPNGQLRASGDVSDYFQVHLLEGQVITLLVAAADPGVDDVDLGLYDDTGTLVDSSVNVGEVEQVTVPATGDYYIMALAFSGASNYTLIIGQELAGQQAQGPMSALRLSNDFVPGETVVKYRDALPTSALSKGRSNIAAQLGFERKAGAPGREMLLKLNSAANQRALSKTSAAPAPGPTKFKSEEDRLKWETLVAIKKLQKDPLVEYAEPNFILKPLLAPNDEYFPLQWHYQQINLPAAWDITTGSQDVTVAVIDTGVLLDHPDMQGQLVAGYDFISSTTASGDGNGIDIDPNDMGDSDGSVPSSFHGSHVAGTIAAASNNTRGVAGVAWNVKVMPLRALGIGGGSGYDINQAIRYAAGLSNDSGQVPENPADIINLSLGGPGFSQVAQNTISAARAAGVTIVAAAGNDGNSELFYPASYDGVISVSAVGPQNTLAPYSNFGSRVDVAAPGGDVRGDINGDGYADGVLSTGGDDSGDTVAFNFNFQNGTSMASPHVAGVIALMKSVNGALTPEQIDALLSDGALTDDLGSGGRDDAFGHGLINAQKAVTAALNASGETPEENPELGVTPASLNFSNSSDLEIILRNNGGGILEITGITSSEAWLTVVPTDSVDDSGLGTYTASVDTSGLADGLYSATITVTTNTGSSVIPVIVPVGRTGQAADAGFVYVLLIDLSSGALADQANVTANSGIYQYQFNNVPAGQYQIIAGSDRDNDVYICDSGEACGAYATLDHPQEISVENGDLVDLDFVINFPSALPTNETSSSKDSTIDPAGVGIRKQQPKQTATGIK